jgi:hypothetical protein
VRPRREIEANIFANQATVQASGEVGWNLQGRQPAVRIGDQNDRDSGVDQGIDVIDDMRLERRACRVCHEQTQLVGLIRFDGHRQCARGARSERWRGDEQPAHAFIRRALVVDQFSQSRELAFMPSAADERRMGQKPLAKALIAAAETVLVAAHEQTPSTIG